MIREATEGDIASLVHLGAEFHAQAPHRVMGSFNPTSAENVLRFLITHPFGVVLWDGQGAVGGLIVPVFFDADMTVMEASFFWGRKTARHLRRAFEEEAAALGADYVIFAALDDDRMPARDRLLRADGYLPVERRYIRKV